MVKFFRLHLAILAIGLLLIGCSSGGDSNNPSTDTPVPKSWGTAELIETDDTGSASLPRVAMDSTGNAIVVWEQSDGNRSNIWANRFDGSSWGTAELIETDDAGGAEHPQIAFDGEGNAIAIWHQFDGSQNKIYANRFDGSSWGSAELIETGEAFGAEDPQIAFDGAGNAIAVWEQTNGIRWSIWANRFDGSSWGTAELIETDDAGNAAAPRIAVDVNGRAIAVWCQYNGSRYNINANRFDGTAWGTAELIETDDVGDAYFPRMAMDDNGNAIAVWEQFDGSRLGIWANRFDGSAWGTAELVIANDAEGASAPQITLDSNGNAIAVWEQSDGYRYNIYANRFDGSSWGSAGLVETDDAGDAYYPQVAFDGDGNAIAVWEQFDDNGWNIWTNRFDGMSWGTAELIEASDAVSLSQPQIAVNGEGNAIAVWKQADDSPYNIWANRFE